ncbi:THUMPD1 family protein [Megaselia abdita]
MSQPQAKKPKMMPGAGAGKNKNYYASKSSRKLYIEPGNKGFLATCNFKERDAIREAYNILNAYADELYGPVAGKDEGGEEKADDDISDALDKVISESKEKKVSAFRFKAIDSGAANCIFIKTTLPNPVELGVKLVKDLAKTKQQKTRYLLRLVPIEAVCKANLPDILSAAGKLFDKYFLTQGKTFSIIYNKRLNNSINRDEIINELAELVALKNCNNKVNLKNPELSVIVEIIKGMCCLSVVEQYIQLKKYNLIEIVKEEEGVPKEQEENVAKAEDVPEMKESNDEGKA